MQNCCETLCAREMMQEIRIVVCDYHDSKSVKVLRYFLNTLYQECQRGTVWQIHKGQCQYAICHTPGGRHLHQQYFENPNSICKMYT